MAAFRQRISFPSLIGAGIFPASRSRQTWRTETPRSCASWPTESNNGSDTAVPVDISPSTYEFGSAKCLPLILEGKGTASICMLNNDLCCHFCACHVAHTVGTVIIGLIRQNVELGDLGDVEGYVILLAEPSQLKMNHASRI